MIITKKTIGLILGIWVGFWESIMIVSSIYLGALSFFATIILPIVGTVLVGIVGYDIGRDKKGLVFFGVLSVICLFYVIFDFHYCLSRMLQYFSFY